jgi:hypothetical protein
MSVRNLNPRVGRIELGVLMGALEMFARVVKSEQSGNE